MLNMDELLDQLRKKQKRHSRKEKEDFIEFLEQKLNTLGFECNIVRTKFIRSVHLETVTDDDVDFVIMAHYDTPTTLPIWYEWLIRVTGHTRNTLTLLIVVAVFQLVSSFHNELLINTFSVAVALSFFIPMFFIENKYSMNDNTSGVLALLLLAEKLAQNDELKSRVKIVFSDNEEKMLIGSYQLRRIWNKIGFDYKKAKMISVDSVGRGDYAIISYNFVNKIAGELSKIFEKNNIESKRINMWLIPFSDAYNFWISGAVNVNMMDKTIIPGGYYVKNIHSFRDKEISKDNIRIVVNSLDDYIHTCIKKG